MSAGARVDLPQWFDRARFGAYQLRVAGSESNLRRGRGLAWDSGKVASDRSVHVPYAGPRPGSGERYYWQVRVWDGRGRASAWSAPPRGCSKGRA